MKTCSLFLLLIGAFCVGCSALTVPEAPRVSNPVSPIWDVNQIRRHLVFLHDRSARGRVDGTVGYGVAASYVGQRLEEYGLQPATAGDFRLLYTTPRNLVRASRVRIGNTDTVSLRPGIDFLPDGRTGNAFAAVSGIGVANEDGVWDGPAIPVLFRSKPPLSRLQQLRQLGVPLALVESGTLKPSPAQLSVRGLGVLHLTSQSVTRILEGAHSADAIGQGVLLLRRPLRIEIIAEEDPTGSGINVVGFVPGKDPVLAREAVLLCTHLDAVGSFGGADFMDLQNYGVEVAAVLDVVRQFSSFSRLTRIPERTLIVAFVAGGTIHSGGFRALLRQPLWDMESVRSIVYVGAPAGGADSLIAAAGQFRDRLRIVQAADTIPDIMIPIPKAPDRGSRPGERQPERERTDPRTYLNEAVDSARELASRIYARVGIDAVAGAVTARDNRSAAR
ncbi:MAG: hypothetical protein KJO98_04440 [Rhodothermia bacterium]|nr:hypothetical protein [Rhodothermia bacterium]